MAKEQVIFLMILIKNTKLLQQQHQNLQEAAAAEGEMKPEIKHKIERTIDSLKLLKEKLDADLYWVVGSDILPEFHRWKGFEKLTELATFLVFPRSGYPLPEKLPKGFEKIDSPSLLISDFSSTAIRDLVKNKRPIKHFVPPGVEKYIIENNLYE